MSAEKFDESKSEKELDHTDTYRGVKWEAWYDAKTKKYDVWLYLKAGKTLVAKDVDPSPYNIKIVAWDRIDKVPASKKKKLAESILEATMRSSTGKTFEIPAGEWVHVKRSAEWEKNNGNDAKGLTGTFRKNRHYLEWQSDNGRASINMDVKDITVSATDIHIKSKGGLEFWFKNADKKTETNEEAKTAWVDISNDLNKALVAAIKFCRKHKLRTGEKELDSALKNFLAVDSKISRRSSLTEEDISKMCDLGYHDT